jgi:predicted chitinase
MAGQGGGVATVSSVLLALLLCGFLGLLGQGVRAIVGLKNAGSLNSTTPSAQAEFSLAYLALSLVIGFIAGVLAGVALNLETIITIDPADWKTLLGIAASGYVGADFVENTMSVVIPGAKAARTGRPAPPASAPPTQVPVAPPAPAAPAPQTTPAHDGAAALADAMRVVCPQANAALWVPALIAAFERFDFSNERRRAAAMGQFLVEAGPALSGTVEDLDYSPERACQVWPALFSNPSAAEPYCADPRRFADHVYAGVNGNGDAASGDGYRFRGRGLIQLTGRDEYGAFGRAIGKTADEAADFCETTDGAAWSGCWYLASNGCLPLADAWDIDAITRRVNGPAMEAAGLRRQYSDEMVSRLREYAAAIA